MRTKKTGSAPNNWFDRLALTLGVLILGWLASVVLTQAYYWMVPAQPSAAVLRLEAEAAQRPLFNANGLQLAGLLAPPELDAEAFGRCLYPDAQANANKLSHHFRDDVPTEEQSKRRLEACSQGQARLTIPAAIQVARATPKWTQTEWAELAEHAPDPALIERTNAILAAGPRRLGPDFVSPWPPTNPLIQMTLWQIARGIQDWRNHSRPSALLTWASIGQQVSSSASDNLFESSITTGVLNRLLLGMQVAVQASAYISDSEASTMHGIVASAEQMPEVVHKAMISEWQGADRMYKELHASAFGAAKPHTKPTTLAWVQAATEALFDPVDSINQFTIDFEMERNRIRRLAEGQDPARVVSSRNCAWMGSWALLCLPHERNLIGRIIVSAGGGDYAAYGTRIADLRNLAAATRLTIEARRRGLQGEALARFVTEAPENMRDIFSKAPFAYDPSQRQLTIQLRGKSTVLGEGSYTLPL